MKEENKVPVVNESHIVRHKIFGKGTISFIDKAQKKLRVKFNAGEKMLVSPDVFVSGHLKVKD